MTIFQQRQYSRFDRSVKYIESHKSDFASGSKALSLRDELKTITGEFSAASQEPKAARAGSRSYTSAKLTALNALREDLVAIARSAEVIAVGNTQFKNTFILPDRRRKDELANAARQFIKDAQPVKADFLSLEMNANFLQQLQERLDAFEATQKGGQGASKGEKIVATDALSTLVGRGSLALDVLDVVIRNKYRGNTEALKAWEDASSLEFTPRRKKGEKAAAAAAKKSA
ncbi:hypothetical protein B1R32_10345 [Abditibacterium utsteinense]|uniref:Uncharacterized protein n=1 Tax=Abditibacterium utsteinense TaxID=1960156 RepID=A0A2S8SVG0_9BACT|nr:hypothetical protein [Abditibacterium utsteinense]PQV64778.1 hypothetical protein B1R32_10345 [Abditibacterium utsteinense]